VNEAPELRASDADRDETVTRLREHSAAGRLTLEEFTERMSAAYAARTRRELEELTRDLPAAVEAPASRRAPTRILFALFSSTERSGRIRVRRRVVCLMGFGNVDLDLRRATLEGEVITILAIGLFGAIDVYVPDGIESDIRGIALFGHADANGLDRAPAPGTPLVRVRALSLFAGIDLWRVPAAWAERTWREVIRGIRRGEHRELEP
jgi:hypothetical protein